MARPPTIDPDGVGHLVRRHPLRAGGRRGPRTRSCRGPPAMTKHAPSGTDRLEPRGHARPDPDELHRLPQQPEPPPVHGPLRQRQPVQVRRSTSSTVIVYFLFRVVRRRLPRPDPDAPPPRRASSSASTSSGTPPAGTRRSGPSYRDRVDRRPLPGSGPAGHRRRHVDGVRLPAGGGDRSEPCSPSAASTPGRCSSGRRCRRHDVIAVNVLVIVVLLGYRIAKDNIPSRTPTAPEAAHLSAGSRDPSTSSTGTGTTTAPHPLKGLRSCPGANQADRPGAPSLGARNRYWYYLKSGRSRRSRRDCRYRGAARVPERWLR